MTKAPTPTEMSKGQSDNTNNATKIFKNFVVHRVCRAQMTYFDYKLDTCLSLEGKTVKIKSCEPDYSSF